MLGSWWFLSLVVTAFSILAAAGLKVVRRFVDHQTLVGHHDVAGYMLSIVGTLYAVVLGFIVVDSLNTFQKAGVTVEREANSLHDIFHLADGLQPPASHNLRMLCLNYAKVVKDSEWHTMENGQQSLDGHLIMNKMWDLTVSYRPATADDTNIQQAILDEMSDLGDSRHTRLIGAKPTYDAVLWTILIGGGTILIIFTYFFGLENVQVQILMTVMLTFVLGLNLIIVSLFSTPYSGDVQVSPAPFDADIEYFQSEMAAEHGN